MALHWHQLQVLLIVPHRCSWHIIKSFGVDKLIGFVLMRNEHIHNRTHDPMWFQLQSLHPLMSKKVIQYNVVSMVSLVSPSIKQMWHKMKCLKWRYKGSVAKIWGNWGLLQFDMQLALLILSLRLSRPCSFDYVKWTHTH